MQIIQSRFSLQLQIHLRMFKLSYGITVFIWVNQMSAHLNNPNWKKKNTKGSKQTAEHQKYAGRNSDVPLNIQGVRFSVCL